MNDAQEEGAQVSGPQEPDLDPHRLLLSRKSPRNEDAVLPRCAKRPCAELQHLRVQQVAAQTPASGHQQGPHDDAHLKIEVQCNPRACNLAFRGEVGEQTPEMCPILGPLDGHVQLLPVAIFNRQLHAVFVGGPSDNQIDDPHNNKQDEERHDHTKHNEDPPVLEVTLAIPGEGIAHLAVQACVGAVIPVGEAIGDIRRTANSTFHVTDGSGRVVVRTTILSHARGCAEHVVIRILNEVGALRRALRARVVVPAHKVGCLARESVGNARVLSANGHECLVRGSRVDDAGPEAVKSDIRW
mmetsp:Transcript_49312/g.130690  ORF Transcript_49312/g.130690 Transcript_49312/m.130690 type:complete len:299 (+) Transcript_49312:2152-3048(+)